jgi:hypothetical protein
MFRRAGALKVGGSLGICRHTEVLGYVQNSKILTFTNYHYRTFYFFFHIVSSYPKYFVANSKNNLKWSKGKILSQFSLHLLGKQVVPSGEIPGDNHAS